MRGERREAAIVRHLCDYSTMLEVWREQTEAALRRHPHDDEKTEWLIMDWRTFTERLDGVDDLVADLNKELTEEELDSIYDVRDDRGDRDDA